MLVVEMRDTAPRDRQPEYFPGNLCQGLNSKPLSAEGLCCQPQQH
jgi:hypothetical protein